MSQTPPNPPLPPMPPVPPVGYGYGYAPEHRNATAILVLGILSLVMCYFFTGIPALVMGSKAMKEIDDSGGRIGGRSTVKAGYVCGMIGTILGVLCGGFYLVFIIAMFAFGDTSGY